MPSLNRHSRLCIRKAAFCTLFYSMGGAILFKPDSLKAYAISTLLLALLALPWLSLVYIFGGRLSVKFSKFEPRNYSDQEISESLTLQFLHLGQLIVGFVLGLIAVAFGRLVFIVPLFIAYAVFQATLH